MNASTGEGWRDLVAHYARVLRAEVDRLEVLLGWPDADFRSGSGRVSAQQCADDVLDTAVRLRDKLREENV